MKNIAESIMNDNSIKMPIRDGVPFTKKKFMKKMSKMLKEQEKKCKEKEIRTEK